MYDYFLPPPIRNFLDSIFSPLIKFVSMARDSLDHAALVAGHGINLDNYFGFFSYLPGSMQAVVNSVLAAAVLLGTLQLVKVCIRIYYAFKDATTNWL